MRSTDGRGAADVLTGVGVPSDGAGSALLDDPALRTWFIIFHARTVFLAVAGVVALFVAGGSAGVGLAAVLWGVVVPYNLWLLRRTRAESRVPVPMASVDQLLCVAIAALFAWALPAAMVAGVLDLATAAQVFARRVVYTAVVVGSVGFAVVVVVFHPELLNEAWSMVSVAVFPVAGFLCALSIGTLMEREREVARRFSEMVEGLDAVVWGRGSDGVGTYVSGRIEELLGYPRERWLADPGFWRSVVHPDDLATVDQLREDARATGAGYQWTARMRTAEGSERVLKTLASPVTEPDGQVTAFHGLSIDVTDEHRARQALQERTREQMALVELAQAAAGELEIDRLYDRAVEVVAELMNAPLCQISLREGPDTLDLRAGVGWANGIDRRRQAAYPADAAGTDVDEQLEDPLLEPHGVRASVWELLQWGDRRYGVLAAHYRDPEQLRPDKGTFLRAVAQLLVTARRRHDIEEQALRSRSLEVIGRFASGIAHDFNNLLMAVLVSAELLHDELSDAAALELLEGIERAGWSATELCQQLLALTKGDPAANEPVDVADVIADTVPLIERLLGADVSLDVVAPAGHVVRSNPAQLQQVLLNLAVNARDAMPDGGRLAIELGAGDGADGPRTRLTIRDTGEGMDAATLERARTAFFTTKAPGEGTGLGLATVESIVHGLGGSLEITSAPGQGTTVLINLPPAGVPAAPAAPPDTHHPLSLSEPATVLVVDDQAMVSGVVAQALRGQGHRVHVAANLREAVSTAESLPSLDLVLTDMVMPEGGGPQVAAALRSTRPHLPVVFMSGYTEHPPTGDQDTFLQKPFTLHDLFSVVQRSLPDRPATGRR